MTRAIKTLVMAAGLAAVTGCADVTAPAAAWAEGEAVAAAAGQGTLTFSSSRSYESGQALSATGGAASIDFQGHVQTGTPCYDVSGSHAVRGSRVVVTVSLRSTGDFCSQVITYHNYTGQVAGLSAGTYTFEIVHSVDGRSSTAFSQQVTVS